MGRRKEAAAVRGVKIWSRLVEIGADWCRLVEIGGDFRGGYVDQSRPIWTWEEIHRTSNFQLSTLRLLRFQGHAVEKVLWTSREVTRPTEEYSVLLACALVHSRLFPFTHGLERRRREQS